MTAKIAFIIGNGPSRKPVDLYELSDSGKVFGCNALYRDFPGLDYLVAIDEGMIAEISRIDDAAMKAEIIFPIEDERYESAEYNPYQRRRSNAGMNAMLEAIRRGHNMLYCLGFDFILEGDASIDNIYKNSDNYGPATRARASDNFYRIAYLEWFARQHPNVTFIMVIPEGVSRKRVDAENMIGMTIPTFIQKLNS
jgi:hypothetical protein